MRPTDTRQVPSSFLGGVRWINLDELGVWLAFVPFMSVDLRAQYDSRVFATDASSRSCAAVFTEMQEDLVRGIWRHRLRRGIGQR